MRLKSLFVLAILLTSTGANALGFDETYKVYSGLLNQDALIDFYVRGRPPIPISLDDLQIIIPSQVREFALINNGNGTFTIQTEFSSAERAALVAWQVDPNVVLMYRDVDADGREDLSIRRMSMTASGALDQIVFAGAAGKPPYKLTAMNTKWLKYHDDLTQWFVNPNYFQDAAPTRITSAQPSTKTYAGFVANFSSGLDIANFVARCQADNPTKVCAISSLDPSPCVRPMDVTDVNGNVYYDPNHNVCQYDTQAWVYNPGTITVEKDYSFTDADARESARILDLINGGCPAVDPTNVNLLKNILDNVYGGPFGSSVADTPNSIKHTAFPGDDNFNKNDPTYHHYDLTTTICTIGQSGCDSTTVNNVLKKYTYPRKLMAAGETLLDGNEVLTVYFAVPSQITDPNGYRFVLGTIKQLPVTAPPIWVGAIQNFAQPTHLMYPGTVSRKVVTKGVRIEVFTHGVGINRAFCSLLSDLRPVNIVLGFSNDVFGLMTFATLDLQVQKYLREHY